MDHVTFYTVLTLLIVGLSAGWIMTLLGLPGNWVMVAAAALYVWEAPTDGVAAISWYTVLAVGVLAGLGELIELVAGVWGANRVGGSRRAGGF